MILCIEVDPKNILSNENGKIIIKVDESLRFNYAAYLYSRKEKNSTKILSSKSVYIGTNGGVSIG